MAGEVTVKQQEAQSNDDGDVNDNGKKAIGLDWQNNNFARASRTLFCTFCTTTLFCTTRGKKSDKV